MGKKKKKKKRKKAEAKIHERLGGQKHGRNDLLEGQSNKKGKLLDEGKEEPSSSCQSAEEKKEGEKLSYSSCIVKDVRAAGYL